MTDQPDVPTEEPEPETKGRLVVELSEDEAETVEAPPIGDKQPRQAELTGRSTMIGLGVVLLAVALGVGGYFVGKGTGEDLEVARAEGTAAGKKMGTLKGTKQGFKTGFRRGNARGYDKAYGPAYKSSYVKAYEDAGLGAPAKSEIEVPDP